MFLVLHLQWQQTLKSMRGLKMPSNPSFKRDAGLALKK
jgi:hypothetical protein